MPEHEILPAATVIKVGGSLYDLPALGPALRHFAATLAPEPVVLVPGGGRLVDQIRRWDLDQNLGDDVAHWLALDALSVCGNFLTTLLGSRAPATWGEKLGHRNGPVVLDVASYARADESRTDRLPHTWEVTADSLAARITHQIGSTRLVLLKSTAMPADISWQEAGRRGLVDPYFFRLTRNLDVRWLNFREWARQQVPQASAPERDR